MKLEGRLPTASTNFDHDGGRGRFSESRWVKLEGRLPTGSTNFDHDGG